MAASTTNAEAKPAADVEYDEYRQQPPTQVAPGDVDELPKNYYYSPRFIGSGFAIAINLLASTGGFAMIAPILGQIDADIGPGSIIWLSLVYTMMLAVGLTLVGQMSDVFGRRYFFIGGTLLGAVGATIASRAQTIPVAIGGEVLVGLSAATGYSYAFVIGELVPMKWRFMANAVIFWGSMPTAGFGSAISTAFVLYTEQGWRWAYYLLIIANVTAAALYSLFYFPPSFHQKHGADTIMRWVKNYDYVGMFLYVAGLLLFILGLSWGGSIYPWKSAGVIAPIIIGFLCLVALMVYEAKANIAEPLVPMHLFKNRGFVASAIVLSLGASVYYSQAIVWPSMASNVYANGRAMWAGWAGTLVGIGITIGEIIGGTVAKHIGHFKYQLLALISFSTISLGSMATCTPDTPKTAMGLVFLGSTAVGWAEAIVLPACNICIKDQSEIGTATGIAGSLRSAISTVASTIYSVVLTARETTTLSTIVPEALTKAGLSPASVEEYMVEVAAGKTVADLGKISGVTADIIAIGTRAYQMAYADSYRTIFFTSIAFGVMALIVALFVPNFDALLTNEVATQLNLSGKEANMSNDEKV
ncbi:siderophore iron transporter [Sporothrix schenckii 1099-18]|uniref:Siderophore iron transporter n=1 Tax=Sporothrix schenckii 1099-18 TaxID=1397361 RepID=A0A0F2MD96_SPOSC|nr:siderophore iron transporter [Sporothrix schenckii 1099-18]KJR86830.1 siderophore iron transporter [Sporothrix schenckii 1099-18]